MMTTGETYTYAIAYQTPAGRSNLSNPVTHTVGAATTSLRIDFPWTPPTVNAIELWRMETVDDSAPRFYLMNVTQVGQGDFYIDGDSHAEFIAGISLLPTPPTPFPTGTGYGYTWYYGYNCYGYGCLKNPPDAQQNDPNPLPDIEAAYVPPTTYTSTKSAIATCPNGTNQIGPVSSVPVMVSTTSPSGVVSDSTEQIGHEGWRAFGTGPDWLPSVAGSSWLQYKFPTTTEVIAFAITPATAIVGLQSQFKLQGSDDGAAWDDLSPTLSSNFIDGARQQFLLQAPDTYLYFRLTMATSADNGNSFVAQTGVALLELLDKNPNSGITKTATATSQTSQADANSKAYNAAKALADAALAQTGCVTIYTSTASFTARCAVGQFDGGNSQGFTASATAQSMVSQTDADNKALTAATTAANAGLHCNGSNNQQAISIIPGAVGSPYPSVEYISSTTPISRVTVNIKQMDYGNPVNLTLLLVSPTGKGVCLMSNCFSGTAMFPSTFSLDSTAISLIPANSPGGFGPGLNGAYLPTNYSASPITPPLPAPQISYPGSFAALMGDNPQGSWSLWVFTSAAAVPVAQIAHGWSITLS